VDWFALIDARLEPSLRQRFASLEFKSIEGFARGVSVVLAGHRAAGKSTLLPMVAKALNREAVDLDALIERIHSRKILEWIQSDATSFRAAERDLFFSIPRGLVVAVGGGFLSLNHDLLKTCATVLIPISFETYVERLSSDLSRPRLRPELSLLDELKTVFDERERIHSTIPHIEFPVALAMFEKEQRALRVVTVPPQCNDVKQFVSNANRLGADAIEWRQDLVSETTNLDSGNMRVLVSKRTGDPLSPNWISQAHFIDIPLGEETHGFKNVIHSFHSNVPMTTDESLARWSQVGVLNPSDQIKHVEPIGDISTGKRLLVTQKRLIEKFGIGRVTVLATGALSLPFRAILAQKNALDYVALDENYFAAKGQRFLSDAKRSNQQSNPRLGIVGTPVINSRSPRIHEQPFDRIDIPADTDLKKFLEALHPFYRGFAVTMPFKKLAAQAIGSTVTVNTLVRNENGYRGYNTDIDGALKVLQKLHMKSVTILGSGGASDAIVAACDSLGIECSIVKRNDVPGSIKGDVMWTWPAHIECPANLSFKSARVAIIAYGKNASHIANIIRERSGIPFRVGHTWLIAQARKQRELWKDAT
jgi:shikimate kinase